ncbi:MAG TPA: DUF4349 domain-containing protein [Candidatus Moranbacteria bacterium]|nr:DUF4349 domain-containing protein [Candidatus Moranbacteria bacterium]
MIILNEKVKKYLKVGGIVITILFLWGVFNLFTGGRKFASRYYNMSDQVGMPMMSETQNDMPEHSKILNNKIVDGSFKAGENNIRKNSSNNFDNQTSDKKIIKNGSLNLKVDKISQATEEISNIIQGLGGEIFSTNFSERIKGQRRGNLTVKVPVVKFSEAISKIKNVATQVINETTTGRDVTEQYADLQVQLRNKQAEEASFVKILDRAGKIDDVLAVTKQIARVRGEIERLQGRIKYMNSQTEMSTITINLSEDTEMTSISDNWRPWQTVKKSFQELINNIQDSIDGIIRFLIVGIPSIIPFVIFLAIIYWGGKKIYQKVKR